MKTTITLTPLAGLMACLAAGLCGLLLVGFGEHAAQHASTVCAIDPPTEERTPDAS